jgi:tripartite-type tricarboxylate transporter receptor subunit TctC
MKYQNFAKRSNRTLSVWLGFLSLACTPWGATYAQVDQFPSRPITIIVPAAIGATSLQIQMLSPCYSRILGKQVLVENRPGAGGAIGAAAVKSARPDGYTLLFAATPVFSVVPHLAPSSYTVEDFIAIGNLTATPMLMAARANATYNSFKEFLAYAKAHPSSVNFASGGVGTSMHLTGEELQVVASLDFTHVPFQGGGPAVQGLLSNSADIIIAPPSLLTTMIVAGKLRPLVLFGETRYRTLPNIPTARELGVDLVENLKSGLLAPRGTPQPIVEKLVKGFADAINDENCSEQMTKANVDLMYLKPEQFERALKAEVIRYDKLFSNPRFASRVK